MLHFADHTALLWSIETGRCLVKYTGHVGSGEHPGIPGSPVAGCAEPFQDSEALPRTGGPTAAVLSGVGSWRDSPAPRATPGRGRLPFTLFRARGAELVGHQSACVSPGQPRTCSGRAALRLALRRLPTHGPLAPRCCGQVSVALLQRPLWPLPLEGSTSSRPVRQPWPPPGTVPPAPDPCAQAWRWHLSSASGASSAHLPTCRGSGGTVCPECLRSCPWAQ